MIEKLNRRDFILSIAGVALAGSGCMTYSTTPNGPSISSSKNDFFVCNYWIDKNQDGEVLRNEFIGVKNSFRANETITLVGIILGNQGASFGTKLFNGNGKLVYDDKKTIPYNRTVSRKEFQPWELYNDGGAGLYQVQWSLNDNLIHVNRFNLIK